MLFSGVQPGVSTTPESTSGVGEPGYGSFHDTVVSAERIQPYKEQEMKEHHHVVSTTPLAPTRSHLGKEQGDKKEGKRPNGEGGSAAGKKQNKKKNQQNINKESEGSPATIPKELPTNKRRKFRQQKQELRDNAGIVKSEAEQGQPGQVEGNQKAKRKLFRQQKLELRQHFGLLVGNIQEAGIDGGSTSEAGGVAELAVTEETNDILSKETEKKVQKATQSKRFEKLNERIENRMNRQTEKEQKKQKNNKREKGLGKVKPTEPVTVNEYNLEVNEDISQEHLIKADPKVKHSKRS